MSAQWAVGEAEMRRTSQPKRAMRPLQGSSATIEVAEEPLRLSPLPPVPEASYTARLDSIYGIRE